MLKPLIEKYSGYVVTEKIGYDVKAENIPVKYVLPINRTDKTFFLKFIVNIIRSLGIVLQNKPDYIISTGALAAVPLMIWTKLLGGKVIYIESFAKINSPNLSGKIAYKFADQFYVQWESMKKFYPNAICQRGNLLMIFITTGSRSFQFNRLLEAVDKAIENGDITDKVFAQVGSSDYKVKNYESVGFLNHEEFNKKMQECDIVLTHGGTGVIVNAVKMGKRVVAVPRLEKFHEVVDDHQIQLVQAFEKLEMVTACYDCDKIGDAIEIAKQKKVKPYVSNTQAIIDSIDEMISGKTGNKIRVLMCSSDRKEKGGMNSVIDQLMDHDWGEHFRFSYLATHITGNPIKKTLFFMNAYKKLKKLIKKNTFDVIHIHMSYKGSFYRKYYVTKLCKKNNKKVIIHLHGSEFKDFYNSGNEKRKKQIRELFTIADASIVLGEDWKKFISGIAPKANVIVINNAVALPNIQTRTISDNRTFLFLGALIQRKGVVDLLEAVKQMKNRNVSNFHVLIAGSGAEENQLKEYTEQNGLQSYVDFLGWITKEQKPSLLEKADVLVLPSYNEGLPIAILEAMSYALPIISTDVGSIAEAVQEDVNGFLIAPGDVNALTDAMVKLTVNTKLWKEESSMSRLICEKKFSEDVFFKEVERVYFDVCKG